MNKVILILSILTFSLFSFANEEKEILRSALDGPVGMEAPFSDEPMSEEIPLNEPSIEELMMKKIDLVNKVEKIDKIESAIDRSVVTDSEKKLDVPDRNAYRPLQDTDGKQVQSAPPFKINN